MTKHNFILLMGSDGSGKSTIAQALSDVLGFPVEHHGPVKSLEAGKKEYFDSVESINYSVIKDRFHEGEKIFAPLYRGYTADYFPELEEKLMDKFNVLLVLVYSPFEVIEKRLDERGEDFVAPEHLRHCFDKVVDIFNESSLPKIMIDTSQGSEDENIIKVLGEIAKRKMY